jgi:hypothetical protein
VIEKADLEWGLEQIRAVLAADLSEPQASLAEALHS